MFTLSPAFSAGPPGELIQLILPEPFPLPLSNLSPNPVTPLTFSSTGIGICSEHFLPPTPCLSIFPTTCTPNADPIVQSEDPLTLNTIFLDSSITQDINPLPQTLPESQPLPLTQIQPQVRIQYPLPVLPFSPIPQIRVCGVYFQNESDYLTSSEIQQLEWNVLQKQHESLWGLPTVVQRSQEEFCSSASNSPYCPPSKAHFLLSSEFREKRKHHLGKRLIQYQWGLLCRIHVSLSLMRPLRVCSEISGSKSRYCLSCISMNKGQSSNN
ncbi:hypothetical protein QTO34_005424 [Cnephaeus nilssonii]|uniref:SPATA31 domain-containing protein n=1 Tax=Cnephaeus nilssonii TaxID=3371016 RepID=A0AA40HNB1_CNENI|nr:hypothetical protein QTO34_005424 [Eptesicus nilssonii]